MTTYRQVERWIDDHTKMIYRWSTRAFGFGCVVMALVWGFWAGVACFVIGLCAAVAGLCDDGES